MAPGWNRFGVFFWLFCRQTLVNSLIPLPMSSNWRDSINQKIVSCQGVLDLSNGNLADSQVIVIASLLQANRAPLKSLSLGSNQLSDGGVRALLAALTVSQPSLESLSLNSNQLSAAGAALIGAWLAANKSLTYLNIGGNSIGDSGVAALAEGIRGHPSIAVLDLHKVSCSDVCLPALIGAMVAPATSPLRSLSLWQNRITDIGAKQLATAISNTTAPLQHLHLSGNMLTDTGAVALAAALRSNRQLKSLTLHGQQSASVSSGTVTPGIGSRGFLALSQALLVNSSVQSLDGDPRSVGSLISADPADAQWLEWNQALKDRVLVASIKSVNSTGQDSQEPALLLSVHQLQDQLAAAQRQLRAREEKEALLIQQYESKLRMLEVQMQIELHEQLAAAGLLSDAAHTNAPTPDTKPDVNHTLLNSSSSTVLLKAPPAAAPSAQASAAPSAAPSVVNSTVVSPRPTADLKRAQAAQLEKIKQSSSLAKDEMQKRAMAAAQSRNGVLSASMSSTALQGSESTPQLSSSTSSPSIKQPASSAASRAAQMQAELARKRAGAKAQA